MVAVISDTDKIDFIVMTSIWYGMCRAGGPVLRYAPGMTLTGVEHLCLSGHGTPGKVQSFSATQIAATLTDSAKGCRATLKELILTCCCAGCDNGAPDTSVAYALCNALRITNMVIEGAMGPSVKANALGETFHIVNKAADPLLTNAFATQKCAIQADTDLQRTGMGSPTGEAPTCST